MFPPCVPLVSAKSSHTRPLATPALISKICQRQACCLTAARIQEEKYEARQMDGVKQIDAFQTHTASTCLNVHMPVTTRSPLCLRHKVPTFAPGIKVGLEFFWQRQYKIDVQGVAVDQEEPGGIKQHLTLAVVFCLFGRISFWFFCQPAFMQGHLARVGLIQGQGRAPHGADHHAQEHSLQRPPVVNHSHPGL